MTTITGWALSGLCGLFLLFDGGAKLVEAGFAVRATEELGFAASQVRVLGGLLVALTLLYLVPRTSVLGAVLLTGYLGGTVAVHYLLRNPLPSHVLFGVYVGAMLWAGLYLRSPELRNLLPIARVQPQ